GPLERAQRGPPLAPARGVGAKELVETHLGAMHVAGDVDQEVAEQAIDQPRWCWAVLPRQRAERRLQLVQAVLPRFVDARRLARRADEESREQIRQRRMVDEVGGEAAQQIGAAQKPAVRG